MNHKVRGRGASVNIGDTVTPHLSIDPFQNLYHDLHAHMLLYSESGRVVDLGRAETAFRSHLCYYYYYLS